MRGYQIFEQRYLNVYHEDGIAPFEIKIGFLDFLRELKGGADGIRANSSFMVEGIDEVLYQAGADERQEISRTIHKILQSAAQPLHQKNIQVQIICKGKLVKGANFWLEYRGEKLPLDVIFGTPNRIDIRQIPVYSTGFNLSS